MVYKGDFTSQRTIGCYCCFPRHNTVHILFSFQWSQKTYRHRVFEPERLQCRPKSGLERILLSLFNNNFWFLIQFLIKISTETYLEDYKNIVFKLAKLKEPLSDFKQVNSNKRSVIKNSQSDFLILEYTKVGGHELFCRYFERENHPAKELIYLKNNFMRTQRHSLGQLMWWLCHPRMSCNFRLARARW